MYMTLFLNGIAVLLLTGNWLIGGFYLVSLTLIVVLRINKEEEAMIAKFGDSYREYMLATHRFLPRVFRR
jgi:protein-S-isoprenylcysteine O-methyltransferase Ste14